MCVRELQKGIPDKFVMGRTGHRDVGLCKNINCQILQVRNFFRQRSSTVVKPCQY